MAMATDAAATAHTRADYPHFLAIPTRWIDNDAYGHVNNATYYAYFDTVVNEHLVNAGGLDIAASALVGLVVETRCAFRKSLTFPERIDAGMRVTHVGTSSVVYEIALFRAGDDEPAATGRFVHVWVDRATQRPVRVPESIRAALVPLRMPEGGAR
jgi:acyl-CoA thioester hydrolase